MGWLGTWANRYEITVDSSKVDAALSDFPVLLYLSTASGIGDVDVSAILDELTTDANRKKIAVTTDDGTTECYVEIEKFSATGDLELHYKLNDNADSSDVTDSTGNGHTGTLSNGANSYTSESTTTGKISAGIDFDGSTYIDLPNSIGLFDGNRSFSIAFWFKPDSIASTARLLTLRGEAQLAIWFSDGSDPDTIDVWCSGSDIIQSTATFGTGSWHHIVLVYDPGQGFALYAAGAEDTAYEGTTSISSDSNDSVLGAKHDKGDKFDGVIDDFRVYSKALSATEVADLYNGGDGTESSTVAGEAWLWVKVPSIASGADTTIYLYYDSGQSDNTTYVGDTGDAVAQSVWDSDFLAVYHLAEDPSGGAGCMLDSTSNENTATPNSLVSGDLVSGQVGDAISFTGSGDRIVSDSNIGVSGSANRTFEALAKADTLSAYAFVFSMGASSDGTRFGLDAGASGTAARVALFTYVATFGNLNMQADSDWHHYAVTLEGTTAGDVHVFQDAAEESRTALSDGTANTTDSSLYIGSQVGGSYPWSGDIDEVRISQVARSDAWIKATYHTCFDSLCTWDATISVSAAFAVTAGVTFSTLDGVLNPDGVVTFALAGEATYNVSGALSGGAALSAAVDRETDRSIALAGTATIAFECLNWTEWLSENQHKASPRYYLTLIGDADELADLEIPVTSFQGRLRSGDPTYLEVVVRDLDTYLSGINARSNGDLKLEMSWVISGEESVRETLTTVDLEEIRVDRGARNESVTLSGHRTVTPVAKTNAYRGELPGAH